MNIVKTNPCHVTLYWPMSWLKSMNGVYNKQYECTMNYKKNKNKRMKNKKNSALILSVSAGFKWIVNIFQFIWSTNFVIQVSKMPDIVIILINDGFHYEALFTFRIIYSLCNNINDIFENLIYTSLHSFISGGLYRGIKRVMFQSP